MIPLEQLHPNPNNPRTFPPERLKKLKDSITDFPKMMALRPMVVDEKWVILGGNMRYTALKELGYTGVPDEWVRQECDLTPEEKDKFLIKDNVPQLCAVSVG